VGNIRFSDALTHPSEFRLGPESSFPAEGSIDENVWGNYYLVNTNSSRGTRIGVANDFDTRAEIELWNHNTAEGRIYLKTTENDGAAQPRLTVRGSGNVGIGTTTPGHRLEVNGSMQVRGKFVHPYEFRLDRETAFPGNGSIDENVWGNYYLVNKNDNRGTRIGVANDFQTRAEIEIRNHNSADGRIFLKTSNDGGAMQTRLAIEDDGKVGIGTNTPSHKLAVNGTIRAKEVLVESQNWPDFVFTDAYDLPTLDEVAAHVDAEGHLPGVPSAASAEANGVKVGAMQRTLLQKIEELTLYAIDREEEVQALRDQVQAQQKQIDALKTAVQRLLAQTDE
jgi:hypothetical protein